MKKTTKFFTFFLLLGIFAFAFGCETSTNTNGNRNAARNNNSQSNSTSAYNNAPAGAQPPNMLGSPTATVTVEEFADFQCPTCAAVHTIMKNLQSSYGSRIKFVYRHFPLTQIHKNAYDASLAAEAAGAQGRFWDMQNQLFANQQSWSNSADPRTLFTEYAQKSGLDVEKFKADLVAIGTKNRVDEDIKRGRALSIMSTPTLFINGKNVPFEQVNLETLRTIIDAELQRAGTSQNQTTAPAPGNTGTSTVSNSAANNANATNATNAANAANTTNAANTASSPAKK